MIAQLIPANPALQVRVVTPAKGKQFSLEELQSFVGGYIERVPVKGGFLYLNEEGKLTGLPRNDRATNAAYLDRGIFPEDFIAGDVLAWTRNGLTIVESVKAEGRA